MTLLICFTLRSFLISRLHLSHFRLPGRYGIEGPVLLKPKEGKPEQSRKPQQSGVQLHQWVVNEKEQTVQRTDGTVCFKVLDTVRVRIEVIEPEPNRPKLSLSLLDVL